MSTYDAAGEDLALQRRCGQLEHDTIKQASRLSALDREVAETKDLIVRMLAPVVKSMDLLHENHGALAKQFESTRKQIRKLFHLASKKRRKVRK